MFLKWLRNKLNSSAIDLDRLDTAEEEDAALPYVWCLIGNIIDAHPSGKEKEIKHGTKHFSPRTKVYCFPPQWGDGYTNIKVIGRHRKSSKLVCMIIPSQLVTHWRLQKVRHPFVVQRMLSDAGWTSDEQDKKRVEEMIEWLSKSIV